MKSKLHYLLTLFLALLVQISFAQERMVSGVVSDNNGLPIPGVNVLVKGTKSGVQTDFDGKYSIKASPSQTLIFNFVGMKSQEIVAASTTINVKMQDTTVELEGVVVTALGIKKEEKKLGYAVSKVSDDEIRKSGDQNVIQSLAGKAAGVQVTGTGGTPGASSKVIIRGMNTITGTTDPLIIVDGVPIDNSTTQTRAGDNPFNADLSGINNSNRALDLNPEDIESVSILKGPAAAALYGERAGNGVILYTTKKAKLGTALGIDYSCSTTIDKVNKLPERQNKYVQGLPGDTAPNPNTPQSWGPTAESLGIPTYDNVNDFFRQGFGINHNLSFHGGTDKATLRASYGNTAQEGMIPGSDLKRNTIRLNGDMILSSKWKAGGSMQYTRTTSTLVQNGSNVSGIMLSLLRSPIQYDLKNYIDGEGNNMNYFANYDNPYFTAYENPATSDVNRVLGNLYATYSHAKWLSLTVKGGFDTFSDVRKQVFAISSNGDDLGGIGEVAYNTINNKLYYGDLLASGLIPLKSEWLKINYTAGLNLRSSHNMDIYSRGKELNVRYVYNLGNATQLYASNAEENIMSRALFAQADFDIKNQLFLEGTVRKEWSSTYGSNVKFAVFPSFSSSWIVSNSFEMPEWNNFLKLYYGYGEVGIAPRPYYTKSTYSQPFMTDGFTDGLSFPYAGYNGMSLTGNLGNENLKPERVVGHEIGLSSKFLDNRLTLDFNVYYKTSKDLLVEVPLARSTGFDSEYRNAAELTNKGMEIELGYEIFKKQNPFQWNINLNWSKNISKVTDIYGDINEVSIDEAFSSIGYYAVEGQPLGSFWGTKWERNDFGQLIIGSNGLPILQDQTGVVGNSNPKWIGGLRNTISWKRVSLSALLDVRYGGDVFNNTVARLHRFGLSEASEDRERTYIIEGVKEDGTPNDTEISARTYYSNYLGDGPGAAEQFIENVKWVRLRDASISYSMNPKSLGNAVSSLEFSITGRNLWLSTNYKGVDPETSLTGAGSRINGLDYFNNPGSKSVIFGVRVSF